MTIRRAMLSAVILAALTLSLPASAGPPAICHTVDIGDAESLPWGTKSGSPLRRYSKSKLVADTVRILERETDALVHMETLRRATLYCERDATLAAGLRQALMARVLDAEAAGKSDPLAWFDAGYLAHCYHQIGLGLEPACGVARGVVGYGWVKHGLTLAGDDAGMEFGAAMITVMAGIPEHHEHVARVRKLADAGSVVMTNLDQHAAAHWPGHRRHGG
jgi:hypothetical protein